MHPSIDVSTLNLEVLRNLPTYDISPSYQLGRYGMGCFLDAPGFPSYMVQPIYTRNGNTPRRPNAVTIVLDFEGLRVLDRNDDTPFEESYTKLQDLYRSIWNPLPLDHPRVQMWMASCYWHFHKCYRDVERPEHGKPGTLIFPVPSYNLKSPRKFEVTPGATPEEMEMLQAAMTLELNATNAFNTAECSRAQRIAIPDNHKAVLHIQEFYPDYIPNVEWINHPPESKGQEDWWETAAERPEADSCTPRNSLGGHGCWDWNHPKGPGRHCHWCGCTNPPAEVNP